MKLVNGPSVLASLGVLCIACSSAFAVLHSVTCGATSPCTGTISCDTSVAHCCCRIGTGVWACTCSTTADCNASSVTGMNCTEASYTPPPDGD